MRKKRVRTFKWYIEPLGGYTNKALAEELSAENAQIVRDDKNESREVYLVDAKHLTIIRKSKNQIGLDFNILCQEGDGMIRDAHFLKGMRKRKATSAVIQQLGRMTAQ